MTRDVVLIFGRTGTGKTTLAKKLVEKRERTITLDPMAQFSGTIFFDFETYADYILEHQHDPRLNVVCRFSDDTDIKFFFILAREIKNYTLVIDEAEIFLEPRSMDENFLWLIRYGRHNAISLMAIGRRVPELGVDLRAQQTTFVTFAQTEPRDLKLLEEYGFNVREIQSLKKYHYAIVGEPI